MQTRFLKGLKPLLVKRVAMLIGICYLLNPLHNQLNDVLHVISHGIEMPDNIIEHDSPVLSDHHLHDQREHVSSIENHEHPLMKTVDLIFGTSSDHDGSKENIPGQVKIDKHLTCSSYPRISFFFRQVEHVFLNPFKKIKEGHLKIKENPPRNFPC